MVSLQQSESQEIKYLTSMPVSTLILAASTKQCYSHLTVNSLVNKDSSLIILLIKFIETWIYCSRNVSLLPQKDNYNSSYFIICSHSIYIYLHLTFWDGIITKTSGVDQFWFYQTFKSEFSLYTYLNLFYWIPFFIELCIVWISFKMGQRHFQ